MPETPSWKELELAEAHRLITNVRYWIAHGGSETAMNAIDQYYAARSRRYDERQREMEYAKVKR
jgi:hypothetical protein